MKIENVTIHKSYGLDNNTFKIIGILNQNFEEVKISESSNIKSLLDEETLLKIYVIQKDDSEKLYLYLIDIEHLSKLEKDIFNADLKDKIDLEDDDFIKNLSELNEIINFTSYGILEIEKKKYFFSTYKKKYPLPKIDISKSIKLLKEEYTFLEKKTNSDSETISASDTFVLENKKSEKFFLKVIEIFKIHGLYKDRVFFERYFETECEFKKRYNNFGFSSKSYGVDYKYLLFGVIFVIYDYIENSVNLQEFIEDGTNLNTENKFKIVYQLLKCIEYFYSIGIEHRDLKLGNVLIVKNSLKVFLVDITGSKISKQRTFASARTGTKNHIGTELFNAPEINLNTDIKVVLDFKESNIFSLAWILYSIYKSEIDDELFEKFNDNSNLNILREAINNSNQNQLLKNLLNKMFNYELYKDIR